MTTTNVPVDLPAIDATSLQAFRSALTGELLLPTDPAYDEHRRIWNAMIDRFPALIVRPSSSDDVASAIGFAKAQGLPICVKGGGHGVAGKAVIDGGLMIDLSSMQRVEVDPVLRIAKAEGGATWGGFDAATQIHGLATTGGVIPLTGIAGLTLGGGIGYLMRSCGLSCDNLIGAEVVTASGNLLRVSETEHPGLLWGLRGGSGNFGVVTSFIYKLHPVGPTVLGGLLIHPFAVATDALRLYRDFGRTAPDELGIMFGFGAGPDGSPVALFLVCYNGPIEDGEKAIAPLRSFGPPVMDMVSPIPYTVVQSLVADRHPHGRQNYWKSSFLDHLTDDAIDVLVDRFAQAPTNDCGVVFELMGGAVGRVDSDATAFGERAAEHNLLFMASWTDLTKTDQNIAWVRESWDAIQPYASKSVYVNYVGAGEEARVSSAFGPNFARLAELKAIYDPENVFSSNHNIPPAKENAHQD